MPKFNLYCEKCDHMFEVFTPYDPMKCPKCDATELKKLITTHALYTIGGDNSASTRPGDR
jgi:putative FmdB family regulatory protein